jgi:inorganic pyrophosphatase
MLSSLASFDDEGRLRVVVETPRNSTLKYKFEPELAAFTVARQLAVGLSYPYDWGFVPGTEAQDGDPLDAMVLHSVGTYPGVVLSCRALGMIAIEQKEEGPWVSNHRLIVRPEWEGQAPFIENVRELTAETVRELEQFFVNTSFFTGKKLRLVGWRGTRAALAMVKRTKVA